MSLAMWGRVPSDGGTTPPVTTRRPACQSGGSAWRGRAVRGATRGRGPALPDNRSGPPPASPIGETCAPNQTTRLLERPGGWHANDVPSSLPDFLPVVAERMRRGDYRSAYEERELTAPIDLCDPQGRLSPAAVGWSRVPLVRANLRGHWPRKKRWNFWNWISPRFVFQVTLADIDYAAFCQVTFIDFDTKQTLAGTAPAWPGSFAMTEHVARTVEFRGRSMRYANVQDGGTIKVDFSGAATGGEQIVADFVVRTPPGQESLNVVVPWTAARFQLNSKHNTLPCKGSVSVGGTRYAMEPDTCHGVQDFGRGIWPYRSFWN